MPLCYRIFRKSMFSMIYVDIGAAYTYHPDFNQYRVVSNIRHRNFPENNLSRGGSHHLLKYIFFITENLYSTFFSVLIKK